MAVVAESRIFDAVRRLKRSHQTGDPIATGGPRGAVEKKESRRSAGDSKTIWSTSKGSDQKTEKNHVTSPAGAMSD